MQSRPDVARWLYWEPRTEDEVRAALERKVASATLAVDGDSLGFAVVLKATSAVIGDASLFLVSAETVNQVAEQRTWGIAVRSRTSRRLQLDQSVSSTYPALEFCL